MVAQVDKPIASTVESPRSKPQRYSLEEYLAIEVESIERHEYYNGSIIQVSGQLPNHNCITGNFGAELLSRLRGSPYNVFIINQRLWIPRKRVYAYPDLMVIQGDLVLQDGRKDTVMNPILIVEVLSDSTADYDRGDKFVAYRTIPGFQEYLLVSQYSQQIEHYVRGQGKKWDFQVYDETDTVVQLSSVGLELAIGDIYDKVEFEAEVVE
jgi:Uma2 family endonuclease